MEFKYLKVEPDDGNVYVLDIRSIKQANMAPATKGGEDFVTTYTVHGLPKPLVFSGPKAAPAMSRYNDEFLKG